MQRGRLLRLLVLRRHTLERDNKVLQRSLLLVALGGLAVHEVVKPDRVLEDVVNTAHDAEHTEREDPDTDNRDDRSLVTALKPSEDTEESGQNVNDENSAGQLPRGKRGPEGTVGTGKELAYCFIVNTKSRIKTYRVMKMSQFSVSEI